MSLQPNPVFTALSPNGTPLVGGLLGTFIAGTTTPQATFTDNSLTIPNTNPVVLNAAGQAVVALNPLLAYKFVLTDAAGNPQWSIDNIQNTANLSFAFTGSVNSSPNVLFARSSNYTGGTVGFVVPTLMAQATVTQGSNNFEWAFLSVMNNHALLSTPAQNVAGYFQGNKFGTAATWALTCEVREMVATNDPLQGSVALELDLSVNGTDNIGSRAGCDLVIRKFDQAGVDAVAGWGYRIQNGGNAGSLVNVGYSFAPGMTANIGFDTSRGVMNIAALRMAVGQPIAFDANALHQLKAQAPLLGIDYFVSNVFVSRLLASGGFQVGANQVIGARIGGYGTPTGGSRATLVPGSATVAQVCALLNAVIVDAETHGWLGT